MIVTEFSDMRSRRIFRFMRFLEQLSDISLPKNEAKALNLLFVYFVKKFDILSLSKDAKSCQGIYRHYLAEVSQKFAKDPQICLAKNKVKKFAKSLKKYKKENLRYTLISYICELKRFFGSEFDFDNCHEMLCELGFFWRFKSRVQKIQNRVKAREIAGETLANFSKTQDEYERKSKFNIAVCATMSSGKSTFINALLGSDCLPARNEATTALITSICDLDGAKRVVGYATNSKNATNARNEFSLNVNLQTIDAWNNETSVFDYVSLQGDFDCISSQRKICKIFDTPGTNNSADANHHKITMDFVRETKLNAMIFITNIEHVSTNDERGLLTELYKNKIKPEKLPVLFVLNKADSIDPQKESVSEIVEKYRTYLSEIGFEDAKVFVVSSRAARILKMVASGKEANLSRKEVKDFELYKEAFLDEFDFDLSSTASTQSLDGSVKVGGKLHALADVAEALRRTGLRAVENEIENLL